jgi:hypothetical protein
VAMARTSVALSVVGADVIRQLRVGGRLHRSVPEVTQVI